MKACVHVLYPCKVTRSQNEGSLLKNKQRDPVKIDSVLSRGGEPTEGVYGKSSLLCEHNSLCSFVVSVLSYRHPGASL